MNEVAEVEVPEDPFDLDVASVPAADRKVKAVPPGKYTFEIIGYDPANNPNNGNRGICYRLRLISPQEEQNLEGIPIERINFDHTMWVTQASAPTVAKIHRSVNPSVTGLIRDFPEQMVGTKLTGVLEVKTHDDSGEELNWPRYRVTKVYPAPKG